jgi:uncharacterized protein YndB with AHSA1/START domain
MTQRRVDHGSFTIERTYAASPERVFEAWTDRDQKNEWFGEGDDFLEVTREYTLDSRVGGHERLAGRFADGREFAYEAIYQDVVAAERLVCSYDVSIDGRRHSVSLMTIELAAGPEGTSLRLTEQGCFLDGLDSNEQRQEGARDSLQMLDAYLSGQMAGAAAGAPG